MGFFGLFRRKTRPAYQKLVDQLKELEPAILSEPGGWESREKNVGPLLKILDEIEAQHPELHKTSNQIGGLLDELWRKKPVQDKKEIIAGIQVLTSQ